jgi:hypothetical protein
MSDASRTPKRSKPIALAIATPLLLVALVEFIVVTTGIAPPSPPPLEIWNRKEDRGLASGADVFQFRHEWLWEPRPGAEFCGDRINEDGYRGPRAELAKTPGRLRIATLGDSTTFGFGLLERESWSRQLETALRARGVDAEVLNFGCVGFTIAQGTALLHGRVRAYAPDLVIFAFGAVNEQFAASSDLTDGEKILLLSSTKGTNRDVPQRAMRRCAGCARGWRARRPVLEHGRVQDEGPRPRSPSSRRCSRSRQRTHRGCEARPRLTATPRRWRAQTCPRRWTTPTLSSTPRSAWVWCGRTSTTRSARATSRHSARSTRRLCRSTRRRPCSSIHGIPSAAGHALYAETVLTALEQGGLIPKS